jgi:uncharacterized protein YbgA (DUF1722 family)
MIDFHTRHKLLLLAHSPSAYREPGGMLARLDNTPLDVLAERYIERVMRVLKTRASRKRHVNVLQHLLGYLCKQVATVRRLPRIRINAGELL